jgi:hypothetical protein
MQSLVLAARHPLFLAVLVIAVLSMFFEWWLLPLGIIIYIAAVGVASRDRKLLEDANRRNRRRGLTSPTFLARLNEIELSQQAALRSLKQIGGPVAARLMPTVEPQTNELVDQAYTLSRKGQDLERYLEQVSPRRIDKEIDEVDRRIAATSDQYTIQQLEGTRQALVQQRDNAKMLHTYIGRVISQLDNINANLNAMPAQFLRMRASDADSNIARSQVEDSLKTLNADMHAFVNVLDSALDQTRAAPSN